MPSWLWLVPVLFVGACGKAPEAAPPFKTVLDIKQTMALVIEPASDVVWDSAGQIVSEDGVEDLAPTTEEGWKRVEHSAAVLMEAGNLLMLDERSQGRQDWNAISTGLIDAGERALSAAQAKDADALFESGAAIYGVCTSCHQLYWKDGGRIISPDE